ncbi:50S ribosomal protein L19 [bioreactor metagenome]|uniref:50S ribosomal protein L19 n=1 Tax=bioreactor metagenome TaxID=1076179 RepID=A0A644UAE2_9ZZZZ|nr:50S ribosomal protein L19 [Candidatus Elulimicrobiales bacterium]
MKTNIKLSKVDMEERKALDFSSGDTIRVWNKLKDKDGKIRLQAFEGLVLARKHGTGITATFTVRKVTSGVGVEKIYPLYSSNIDRIEIVRKNKARRSKLYYVRDKAKKDIRRKLKADTKFVKKDGVTTTEVKEEVVEEGVE